VNGLSPFLFNRRGKGMAYASPIAVVTGMTKTTGTYWPTPCAGIPLIVGSGIYLKTNIIAMAPPGAQFTMLSVSCAYSQRARISESNFVT
jgi:hypothetical protein